MNFIKTILCAICLLQLTSLPLHAQDLIDVYLRPEELVDIDIARHRIASISKHSTLVVTESAGGRFITVHRLSRYCFDEAGRLSSDTIFELKNGDTLIAKVANWTWDQAGRIIHKREMNQTSGGLEPWREYEFHYDSLGHLQYRLGFHFPRHRSVKWDSLALQWDAQGHLVKQQSFTGNGADSRLDLIHTFHYNPVGKLDTLFRQFDGAPVDTFVYHYDHRGRLISRHFNEEFYTLFPGDSSIESTTIRCQELTTWTYDRDLVLATTRTKGLDPVDPNYLFLIDEKIFSRKGLLLKQTEKRKDHPRDVYEYRYNFYPKRKR